ncbi:MAG TPA: hypothetical protein VHW47_03545, partial [Acidimicrobiales bacterium]|nr:hypothetical protein [Acidimicrobiales bacterium]
TAAAPARRSSPGRTAAGAASQPRVQPDRSSPAPLRVVRAQPRPRVRRRRAAAVLSLAMIGASLLSVVVGHAMLAQGQVRLAAVQSALSAEQSAHRQDVIAAAKLETPSRIVAKAHEQGMAPPGQTNQLPRVPLDTPLPEPTVGATTTTSPSGQ